MGGILICACEERANAIVDEVAKTDPAVECEVVSNGIDAIGRFAALAPESVIIEGNIDGRSGLRVAWALAQHRRVPMTLLVAPEKIEEVELGVEQRGLYGARVLSWTGTSCPTLGARIAPISMRRPMASSRPEIESLATNEVDVVVVLGSAGTPHLLPILIPRLDGEGVPLLVAVHHNARLSASFRSWISKLAGAEAVSLQDMCGDLLPKITVALARPGVEDLQPGLGDVLHQVLNRGLRPLVIVTSGMVFGAVDAARRAVDLGGTLVALHPDDCSHSGMVRSLVEAGLEPMMCSAVELADLILRTTGGEVREARYAS